MAELTSKERIDLARQQYQLALHGFTCALLAGNGKAADESRNRVHDVLDALLDAITEQVGC